MYNYEAYLSVYSYFTQNIALFAVALREINTLLGMSELLTLLLLPLSTFTVNHVRNYRTNDKMQKKNR